MSEHLDAPPASNLRDNKDENLGIYFTPESLKVYDNPWVEPIPSYPPQREEPRLQVVIQNSQKRKRVRADTVILGVLCFFLLAGIICLAVIVREDKYKANEMKANISRIKANRDALWNTFCDGKNKNKCKLLKFGND